MSPNDDTKSRLLEAAGRVFSEKGYDLATVREICLGADANVAAVHYYFGDKSRLYIEAVREAQCARAEDVPIPQWQPEMSSEDKLRDFIKTFLTRLLGKGRPDWHLGIMLRELAHPTQACHELVRDYIRPMADVLKVILDDFLPASMPMVQRHLIGFSIVGQCLFYYVHKPIIRELVGDEEYQGYHIDLLADHIARFTLSSLQSFTTSPPPVPLPETPA
ncbi:CerR family C-terminal domain-containing protein [bacterium]|jgi:TetR/AcrR family transcriptional regulator, regulator of cefoperazone and chloramphenicol sensitivity|nr:CerR family C-terminal domain-containing protein [bacterium]